ncbi:helix-turn-helix domain-containing protein [Fulvivirga imtechensis]|uniref:helix-turn-helix domain-containing protein n=1 Tax=Fulvivirga imtechensis TaxID=881893 RepID=UPI001FDF8B63|nr:helix-turn-helix transcriptional regulator [Fulvivirga imtechensis]
MRFCTELATIFNTSHTTIGKYERDEMKPSIEAAKKLAKILDTTVGYLLGETEEELFKDQKNAAAVYRYQQPAREGKGMPAAYRRSFYQGYQNQYALILKKPRIPARLCCFS